LRYYNSQDKNNIKETQTQNNDENKHVNQHFMPTSIARLASPSLNCY
jgi:hypothetical protein